MPKDEYEGPNRDEATPPEQTPKEAPAPSVTPNEQKDYEALFMKDAIQRAHDAELSALASLALIRSDRDLNGTMLLRMERDMSISPRVVDRHLRADEALSAIKDMNRKSKPK